MEVTLTIDLSDRFAGLLTTITEAISLKAGVARTGTLSPTATGTITSSTEQADEPAPTHKRTTKKATTKVEDAETESAAPAAPSKDEAPETESKGNVTLADLRPGFKKLWADHKDDIDAIYKRHGATGLKDLDPAKYAETLEDLQQTVEAYGL